MQLAMIGLGKMGGFMAQRLLRAGHQVVGLNRSPEDIRRLALEFGLDPAFSLEEVKTKLKTPRFIWIMVPSGPPTEEVITQLSEILEPGDTIIDGGNTYYKDDIRRASLLLQNKLNYLDVGTSGGV